MFASVVLYRSVLTRYLFLIIAHAPYPNDEVTVDNSEWTPTWVESNNHGDTRRQRLIPTTRLLPVPSGRMAMQSMTCP